MQLLKPNKPAVRNSGIELLKVLGIFLIVISHVVQSLDSENALMSSNDYVLNLSVATTDIQQIILSILQYSGVVGNTIFFISSAWFLIDSKKVSAKKWFSMFIEVWIISVIILITTYIARSGDINAHIIIKSLMPTTFSNNWYITCYLLFYPIHTILNKIINDVSKIQLLRIVAALSILYIGFNFIKTGLFFWSVPILWITIYFAVAYVKIYLKDIASDKKVNVIFLCVGALGNLSVVLFTNFLGLRMGFFTDKLLKWDNFCNPFIIISVIALFNLMRSVNFKNRFINYVSSLSLLIYIIHENIILRQYYRPLLFMYIYENFGYDYILLWVLLLSAAIFVGCATISFVYDKILRIPVNKLSQFVCRICTNIWSKFENFALKLH